MTEAQVQAEIRLALGRLPHVRLFRNQVGEGWMGDVIGRTSETVTLLRPRHVTFGLAPSSADLVGWTSVTITPEMVGQRVAIFTTPEVKRPAIRKLPDDQQHWCDAVRAAGGLAGMVRSPAEALELVGGARHG